MKQHKAFTVSTLRLLYAHDPDMTNDKAKTIVAMFGVEFADGTFEIARNEVAALRRQGRLNEAGRSFPDFAAIYGQ